MGRAAAAAAAAAALLLLCAAAAAAAAAVEGTAANFDALLAQNDCLFVKFTTPTCPHCIKLAPSFEVAAAKLRGQCTLVGVDCATQVALKERFAVQMYPSLVLFVGGAEVSRYNGDRSAGALVTYVRAKLDDIVDQRVAAKEAAAAAAAPPGDAAAAAAASAGAAAPAAPPAADEPALERDGDVVVASAENLDRVLALSKFVFVKFYSPQCGHCVRMAADFKAAAERLRGGDVTFAQVNVVQNGELARTYQVYSYPTLKLFEAGAERLTHSGARTADAFVRWLKSATEPIATHFTEEAALVRFLEENAARRVVVGHRPDDANLRALFDRAVFSTAVSVPDMVFATVQAPEMLRAAGGSGKFLSTVVRPPAGSEDEVAETTDTGVSLLETFLKLRSRPAVERALTKEVQAHFSALKLPALLALVGTPEQEAVALSLLRDAAKVFGSASSGPLLAALVQRTSDLGLAARLEVSGADAQPVFALVNYSEQRYFVLSRGTPLFAELLQRIEAALGGEVEPVLRSEPVPAANDGAVTEVVGKTWRAIVHNSDGRDVFIEQYAPWCGHCKKLAPTWEELGAKLAGSSVVVARMDGSANDPPTEYRARGFPTLQFFKAGSTKPVPYQGARTLDALLAFVEQHRTKEQSQQPSA